MLFKSWFVDFVPYGGSAPSGWNIVALPDIAEFVSGYSYKSDELVPSNYAMASIKNFDRDGGFKIDGYKEIRPSDKVKDNQYANVSDVLVAHTDLTQNADVVGNAELVISKGRYQGVIFSSDLVKVVSKFSEISNFLIYSILKSREFKAHCMGYINGTTVLHLSKKALSDYTFLFPCDPNVLKPLEEVLSVLYKSIFNNIEENSRLETLRNTLLPKLMSGEIDVSQVDLTQLNNHLSES